MKAAFNGALNLSILDGWWAEAWSPQTGWAIGTGEEYTDHEYQDRIEAAALYDLLETEVVPLFYRRGADGIPRGWIALMRSAMTTLCPVFNTNRMVHEYVVRGYVPADTRRTRLEEDDFRRARALARWKATVREAWHGVRIDRVDVTLPDPVRVGVAVDVVAWVRSGGLNPTDLAPQVYLGHLRESREIVNPEIVPMTYSHATEPQTLVFRASIPCRHSGIHGLTVRVLPRHEDLGHLLETRLIAWAP
jgi:starch phosphorylase